MPVSRLNFLNSFRVIYFKMIKNFLSFHFLSVSFFLLLTIGLSIILSKEILSLTDKYDDPQKIIIFIVIFIPSLFMGTIAKGLNFDESFVKEITSKQMFFLLRTIQIYAVLVTSSFILSSIFLFKNMISPTLLVVSLFALIPVSMFSTVFLFKSKRKIARKPLLKGEWLIKKIGPPWFKKTYSIICLNFLYILRKGHSLYYLIFNVFIFNLCIVAYLVNNQKENIWLFTVPFAFPVLQAFNSNSEIYDRLKDYTSFSKFNSFIADFTFWSFIIFLQWLITFFSLKILGFNLLEISLSFMPVLIMLLTYILLVKMYFIGKKLTRAMVIGISIGLPLLIPIIIILAFKDFKNDLS